VLIQCQIKERAVHGGGPGRGGEALPHKKTSGGDGRGKGVSKTISGKKKKEGYLLGGTSKWAGAKSLKPLNFYMFLSQRPGGHSGVLGGDGMRAWSPFLLRSAWQTQPSQHNNRVEP